ncbi:MAG TPA: hypothetical protein VH985_17525 [Candidatus Binatia bacterium]
MIDPLLEHEKVSQAHHLRQAFYCPRVCRRRREGNATRINQRNLATVFEQQNKIDAPNFWMNFLFDRFDVTPNYQHDLPRRYVEQPRGFIIIENGLLVALNPGLYFFLRFVHDSPVVILIRRQTMCQLRTEPHDFPGFRSATAEGFTS